MSVPPAPPTAATRWTPVLAGGALVAFAANSLLCRMALAGPAIDAASFTTIRLASGALVLLALGRASPPAAGGRPRWRAAVALFLYAIAFSYAYLSLPTGTGALILFGAVQTTMLAAALRWGERPRRLEWAGLACALGGLVYLVLPGLAAPPLLGSALMALAGMAWGWYSLWGRGSSLPLADTTVNFVRAVPFALAASLATIASTHMSPAGVLLAVLSGSGASALGYITWYAALPALTATRAAMVQLPVPLLTAFGGVLLLGETLSLRLLVAAVLILGGTGAAVLGRASGTGPPVPASSRTAGRPQQSGGRG